jgi:hypothetical protein
MADSTTDEFKHFPKLPAELREEIWRLCLPYRVCELETPAPELLFMKPSPTFNGPWPCELLHTSYMNKRLPLISKVCHEARYVALKNGAIARQKTDRWPWGEGVWGSTQDLRDTWQDPQRDIVHRHWTRAYEAYYDFDVSNKPISHLVYTARQMRNGGSLMAESLFDHCFSWPCNDDCELSTRPLPPDRIKALEALLEVPEWRVIVKVVVVHCDLAGAARTGLFGLLETLLCKLSTPLTNSKWRDYTILRPNQSAQIHARCAKTYIRNVNGIYQRGSNITSKSTTATKRW